MFEFPLGLRHAIESGECVLFLGAGIGDHLLDKAGDPAPDGATLAEELVDKFNIDTTEVNDLSKIAMVVELRKGRKELETFLTQRLAERMPDSALQWLFTRKWKAIFTTNYDNGIERAYELLATPPQNHIVISSTADLVNFDRRFEVPVYHLHGILFGAANPHIIITDEDYTKFSERRKMLFDILKTEFATSTLLYIGYSNRDPNWKQLLSDVSNEFYPSKMPTSYRVNPGTSDIDVEILRARGIETIRVGYRDFYEVASSILETQENIDEFRELRKDIPSDLAPFFDKHLPALVRFRSAWNYVNQAPFDEKPNFDSFLQGDRPNWALIAKRQIFERDIEGDIYSDLLDYATNVNAGATAISILGPAGYGTSTLLMTLAARLVNERAGRVYMLKPSQELLEGDIDFAVSLFREPTFFFIDNASDHSDRVNIIIQKLKESNRSAIFILGEHINEWRQSFRKPITKEFILESLSDPEIIRLLDYLRSYSQLNALESLSRDRQISVIKEKHKKELLIVMREATEGKSFDAILEGEYRGITDLLSKQLYSIVCCFYQHEVYVRDELLARLLNISLPELYEKTLSATEGVVFYDCINESKQIFGARSRHRIIAQIVWERCLDVGEKSQIIQTSLESLNLNYGPDNTAFEMFTRDNRLVDSIGTLEGKTKFFETAARKDPESPYVRQHYARMLLREDKLDLALGQIESGLKINSASRVLIHTKGLILMELAMSTESVEMAKRRLVQSEACFRQCITMFNRDEYSYQGLADLFIRWANRAPTQEEALTYISKAEEVITAGLRVVRVRDGLWVASAKIQQWLGDEPSRLQKLEEAIIHNPGTIIARYLLGRAYRKAGRMKEALEVLEPNIANHHEEFRSFVEYAIALSIESKSFKEAISILRISDIYGLSDPRYIATLGGMLFMDKNFSEATRIFAEVFKRSFTGTEVNSIQYRPPNFANLQEPLRFNGKVVDVQAGHAVIETPAYPAFFCPGSKFAGLIMQKGLNITFEPAFRPKGNIADQPKLVQ